MSLTRVGRRELSLLRQQLSERDWQILSHVGDFRLLAATQIQSLLFADEDYATPATAARCCRRALERLTRLRLLNRLDRRVGGSRSGSASYVYSLGAVGERALSRSGPRRRLREPSEQLVAHTLAIAEFFVHVQQSARQRQFELLAWEAEPRCWRSVSTLGGALTLRPDLFVVLGIEGYELRWFIEIDRGTEHTPALRQRFRLYQTYYRSGREQRQHQVFPRVLWLVEDERRLAQLRKTIQADQRLNAEIFRVALDVDALATLGEVPA